MNPGDIVAWENRRGDYIDKWPRMYFVGRVGNELAQIAGTELDGGLSSIVLLVERRLLHELPEDE